MKSAWDLLKSLAFVRNGGCRGRWVGLGGRYADGGDWSPGPRHRGLYSAGDLPKCQVVDGEGKLLVVPGTAESPRHLEMSQPILTSLLLSQRPWMLHCSTATRVPALSTVIEKVAEG